MTSSCESLDNISTIVARSNSHGSLIGWDCNSACISSVLAISSLELNVSSCKSDYLATLISCYNINTRSLYCIISIKLNDSFGEWSSPWTFAVGYVFMIVVLADAVFLVLNLIWKIKLMKGEKALLSQNAKEVA